MNRKKIRLENFDYSTNGAYYVTVCTANKEWTLCEIRPAESIGMDPIVTMTAIGQVVEEATKKIPGIDKYVIMPNHVHMIIYIRDGKDLPTTIRLWKSVIARKTGKTIWQNRYYDHIIRDERDYLIKWKYIDDNPAKWATDDYYEKI